MPELQYMQRQTENPCSTLHFCTDYTPVGLLPPEPVEGLARLARARPRPNTSRGSESTVEMG
ncbi:Nucleolar complex protein 2, partial [Clarias magur]